APVEVQRSRKRLVTTIWRRGESEAEAQPPLPPKPVEVHRSKLGSAEGAGVPGGTHDMAAAQPATSLRETLTPEAPAGISGFAQSAQAAVGARLPL
ncbi:hypothetical protein ABTF74_19495, partial [Acinetobacter baumannii]